MTWRMNTCSATADPRPTEGMALTGKIPLLLAGLLFTAAALQSQSIVDDGLANVMVDRDTVSRDFAAPLRAAGNDVSVIASAAFLVYKEFISSQDNPSCVFTPSCSEYAVEAFHRHGFVVGWLKTFDRLSRCHGLVNPVHYRFDTEKMRYEDPVD